jgi:hypothetical protein
MCVTFEPPVRLTHFWLVHAAACGQHRERKRAVGVKRYAGHTAKFLALVRVDVALCNARPLVLPESRAAHGVTWYTRLVIIATQLKACAHAFDCICALAISDEDGDSRDTQLRPHPSSVYETARLCYRKNAGRSCRMRMMCHDQQCGALGARVPLSPPRPPTTAC